MCACSIKIMNSSYLNIVKIAFLTIILCCVNIVFAQKFEDNLKISNSSVEATSARALLSKSDEYVRRNQKQCLASRSFISCLKYKTSKIVWKLATNSFGFFPNEYSRESRDDDRRIRVIQTDEPVDVLMFKEEENRSLAGESELFSFMKFIKRAAETFGRNHAIQLSLSSDSGARIKSDEVEEPRLGKKKKKWLIILPLIILMKIAHLKMTMVTLLFGVLGANALLIGGVGWLIHYLKFKTLCKIHPQLVQSHSHVYDSDPAEYSQFVGSSFPGSHYSGAGLSAHDVSLGGYSKDWGASSKAYGGYNYLDTISKRLQ